MIEISKLLQPDRGQPATSLHLVDKKGFEAWLNAQPPRIRDSVAAQGFKGEGFQLAVLPDDGWSAAIGVANVQELSPWCLARAAEEEPELILDFATLTGAARVALGPDLPALFANDDLLASALLEAGTRISDPLWRMPLWKHYEEMLSSDIADLGNVSDAPMAGSVTAALFLQKFVPEGMAWAHFDTFAWRSAGRPGRPKGGDALGMRAAWEMLRGRYER